MADDGQESITRGEQLRFLRDAKIPKTDSVSGATLKTVLRAIDDYARDRGVCYASTARLSKEIGYNPRTIKRAISALEKLRYIVLHRREGQTSEISVSWDKANRGHGVHNR